jgi:hypothetical protein
MITRRTTILAGLGSVASTAALAQSTALPDSRPAATTQATTQAAAAAAATRPATGPIKEPVVSTFDLDEATRINLDLKGAPPKTIFAEIARQSGIELRANPKDLFESVPFDPVDLRIDNASLFSALRQACDRTGVSVQRVGPMREFILMNGRAQIWGNYPSTERGPFMVTVRHIQRQNTADLTKNTTTRVFRVQLNVYAEPRLRVVRSYNAAVLDQASDELGHKLTMHEDANPVPERAMGATWSWGVQLPLATPENAGSTLALLKGHARAIVVTKSATAEIAFDERMKDHTTAVGNAKVTVKSVERKQGDQNFTVTLAVEPDPAKAEEWSRIGLESTFRLVDKDGRNLMRQQYGAAGGKTIMLMFMKVDWNGGDPAGEPERLIWEVPLEMREVKIPFEFRDLPLP